MDVLDLGPGKSSKINIFAIEDILELPYSDRLDEMQKCVMKAKNIFVKYLRDYRLGEGIEAKAAVFYYLIEVEQKIRFLRASIKKGNIYYPLVRIKESGDFSALSIFPEGESIEIYVCKGGIAKDVGYGTFNQLEEIFYPAYKPIILEYDEIVHPRELKQPTKYSIKYVINDLLKILK